METTIDSVIIDINSSSENANKGLESLIATLGKLQSMVNPTVAKLSNLSDGLKKVTNNINQLNKQSKKDKGITTFTTKMSKIGKAIGIGTLGYGISKLTGYIKDAVAESNDYIENLNLFYVSMGKNAEKAKEFADNFSEVLGVDPSKVMRYTGMFNTLAEGFGIASDKAYIMSKNLTQLSYDMSSFLNIPIDQAMQKIKSGFSGEIEPMRAVGIALDQASLQETAYKLGIEQRVETMTRAQKTELLYYQMMTRTTKMQGDMARTLLQPANAIRVLQQQFTQLARAVGNIFIPIITAVIPYLQILTKWLTAAAQAIATFFGFKLDVNAWSNGLEDISGGIADIGDSAKGTNKELKKMLAQFDELNVIDFGDDKGSGGSGGAGGGGSLNIPLPEYDALSGALNKNLKDIEEKLKGILPLIEMVLGFLITLKALKIVNSLIDMGKQLGLTAGAMGVLKKTAVVLQGALSLLAGAIVGFGFGSLIDYLTNGNQKLEETIKIIAMVSSALGGIALIMTGNVIPGLALLGISVGTMIQDMTNLNSEINIFRGVSPEIANALKPTIDALQSTEEIIKKIDFTGLSPSQEEIETLKANFDQVIQTYKDTELAAYNTARSAILARTDLSEEEKQKQLDILDSRYSDTITKIEEDEARINEIIAEARENGFILTREKAEEIYKTIEEYGRKNTELLTNNKQEEDKIWSKYEANKENITKKVASELVSTSAKTRDDTIAAAEKTYEDVIRQFRTLSNDADEATRTMAKNNIANAEYQRNETVQMARDQHLKLVSEIQGQNKDIFNDIDANSGKILTLWDKTYGNIGDIWADTERGMIDSSKVTYNNLSDFLKSVTEDSKKLQERQMELADEMFKTSDEFSRYKSNFDKITDSLGNAKNGFENIKGGVDRATQSIRNYNSAISNLRNVKVSISTTPVQSVQQYATGGFPDQGQYFIARENGPELVGSIGRKSAVVNNGQIIEGVAEGVKAGVSEAMAGNNGNRPVAVYIGNKKVYEGYGEYANVQNNMYGTNVIKV